MDLATAEQQMKGSYNYVVELSTPGIYLVRLKTDDRVSTTRITIM